MKTVKMSLANLEGKLSRKEMKEIMAGSGGYGSCTVTVNCSNGSVSCTGSTCTHGNGWVSCDGTKTSC